MTIAPAAAVESQVVSTAPSLKDLIGAFNPDGSVNWLNLLLYGEPSAGKTYFFGSVVDWPEEFLPALLIDIDGGWETLRHKSEIDISPPIRTIESLTNLYNTLSANYSKGDRYYKIIGLDNISELQKMDMNEVMREAKRTANNPEKVDVDVPSQREWGKNGERMRKIIRAYRDLPCHTICMAHFSEREDKMTKIDRIWPGMPGQMRHEILGFFAVAGYLSVYEEGGEIKRQIQFKKTKKVQARDRFQILPDVMLDNPTLPQIWKIIKDSGAKIKDDSTISALQAASITPTSTT